MSEWIEWKWTEEKPYPETMETRVQVLLKGGTLSPTCFDVGFWMGGEINGINNFWKQKGRYDFITHYRLA